MFRKFIRTVTVTGLSALFFLNSGISASALDRTPVGSVITCGGSIVAKYPGMIEQLSDAMLEHRTNIDVSGYNIPFSEKLFTELVEEIRAACPEAFYIKGLSCSINGSDNLLKIVPTYTASAQESKKMLAEFGKAADYYLDIVKKTLPDGDDFSKALLLHDLIASNSSYVSIEKNDINYGAYEILVKGTGNCYCYSRAYAYLLAQLGIPSEIVYSDSMNHEWVKVRLGDKYYHVDLTWDDSNAVDELGYTFFLLSDDRIKLTFPAGAHTDFETVTPSDDKYDMKLFHSFTTPVCFANNKIYTVYDSALVRYEPESNSIEKLVDLSGEKWYFGDGSRYWLGCYSGACSSGGMVFYNTADEIFMYDPKNGSTSQVCRRETGNAFYGMRTVGDTVYAVCRANPDSMPTAVKLGSVCKVTYLSGTGGGTSRQVLFENGKAEKPEDPVRKGYEFTGWKLNGRDYDFSAPVKGNITLTAGWKSVSPELTAEQIAAGTTAALNISRALRTDLVCPRII